MSRFYELLQDFFSPILLVNYMISSLLICMVGLQIVAVNIRTKKQQRSDYMNDLPLAGETDDSRFSQISRLHCVGIVATFHLVLEG